MRILFEGAHFYMQILIDIVVGSLVFSLRNAPHCSECGYVMCREGESVTNNFFAAAQKFSRPRLAVPRCCSEHCSAFRFSIRNAPHCSGCGYVMCREGESNSHGLLRTILSRVRLPVPPSRLSRFKDSLFLIKNQMIAGYFCRFNDPTKMPAHSAQA